MKGQDLVEEKGLLANVELYEEDKGIGIRKSGCHGFCEEGPLVRIETINFIYKSKIRIVRKL